MHPQSLTEGNRAELLVDGAQAFPSMLEAIAKAERFILMASYIFNDDTIGRRFATALEERAKAGVAVRLIVDGFGTLVVPAELFDGLRASGVEVLEYRSPVPWRRSFGLFKRDHRKLLVVDGRVGFAGGVNIGDEWLPPKDGGLGWHDFHVRVEGPAVRDLGRQAVSTWNVHRGVDLDPRLFLPLVDPCGDELVSIIGSRERKKRATIRRAYLLAIKRAERHVYIANAYFLPGVGFRRALRNAVKRGVDVRVMVPERGDILSVQRAGEALYGRLLRAGVRVFLWREAVLHAKTATIDDEWATIGSFNIDHRSWRMNLEVNVNVVSGALPRLLRERFLADQGHCLELERRAWRRRPLWLKIAQRFFHLFRKFM